ncbi:type II toxin-antitoxin system HicA family toxin [Dehalogenimonas alkenigignens]|uniref:type II toxin-antitoxin system HicA family toxin n=1 Tax=Dehalogenimonas alkenigignens TaxID=1217799 RepID=UPI00073055F7|nr:type II toxin-antitoxin system HicA family toxin [Dehalogenimonas alkenigignens]
MKVYTSIPAISGNKLIALLQKDGWSIKKHCDHGVSLFKNIGGINLVTVVPTKNDSLPEGTLQAILGSKQTKIGKNGLLSLINRYGL